MKNWDDFNIYEQVEIIVMFIRDKRDDLSLAEQCSLEYFLYKYTKKPTYSGNIEPKLVNIKQLNDWLVQDGLEEWFTDNMSDLQDISMNETSQINYVFWKEGWDVIHNGIDYVVVHIENALKWKVEHELDFLPIQLESDLDAIKLAERYGFEFDFGYHPTRITKPCFAK